MLNQVFWSLPNASNLLILKMKKKDLIEKNGVGVWNIFLTTMQSLFWTKPPLVFFKSWWKGWKVSSAQNQWRICGWNFGLKFSSVFLQLCENVANTERQGQRGEWGTHFFGWKFGLKFSSVFLQLCYKHAENQRRMRQLCFCSGIPVAGELTGLLLAAMPCSLSMWPFKMLVNTTFKISMWTFKMLTQHMFYLSSCLTKCNFLPEQYHACFQCGTQGAHAIICICISYPDWASHWPQVHESMYMGNNNKMWQINVYWLTNKQCFLK